MSIDYRNKLILAPMVRIGTLPMRLLALKYGAQFVYTEEIIDFKLLRCKRIENHTLGTIDYVDDDHTVVFRTCEYEKNYVILQIGTCDSERALRAAKLVCNDVAGIDINMGCPKEFSLKGGMGAALLTQPAKIKEILTKLVTNINKPVSCKIRVLPKISDCIELVKLIESTGVKAIAVHGRTKYERSKHSNRNDTIKAIVNALDIPVIANGGSSEIITHKDIEVFRNKTGASSVMLARVAEHNCSIFMNRDNLLPIDDVIKDYLKYAVRYDNLFTNTKYCVQQILGSLQQSPKGKKLLASQQMKELCELWDMTEYYETQCDNLLIKKNRKSLNLNHLHDDCENKVIAKRQRIGDENDFIEMPLLFIKRLFPENQLPRTVLYSWTKRESIASPKYECRNVEKHFYAIVTVNGKRYSNIYLEKNKKNAEQSAALVAVYSLNLLQNNEIIYQCLNNSVINEKVCDAI